MLIYFFPIRFISLLTKRSPIVLSRASNSLRGITFYREKKCAPDGKDSISLHLLELRYRAFYFLLSFIGTFLLGTSFSTPLTHLICTPFSSGMGCASRFIFTHVTEGLYATLQVSLVCALSFCAPLLIYQLYSFFIPSCYQGERAAINVILFFIALLFFISLLLAFFLVLPKILYFLQQFQHRGKCLEITLEARIGPAVHWSCTILFLTTFFFQTPVLFFFLLHWGVVQHSFLRKKRKYALFSLLLLASLLSPPDVSGQCVFTALGCFFYELGIWFALFHHNWTGHCSTPVGGNTFSGAVH